MKFRSSLSQYFHALITAAIDALEQGMVLVNLVALSTFSNCAYMIPKLIRMHNPTFFFVCICSFEKVIMGTMARQISMSAFQPCQRSVSKQFLEDGLIYRRQRRLVSI